MILAAVLIGWFLLSVVVAFVLTGVIREGNRMRDGEDVGGHLASVELPTSSAHPAPMAGAPAHVPAQAPREYPLAS